VSITDDVVRSTTAKLYEKAIKKVPEDIKGAINRAVEAETSEVARQTLRSMLRSADASEKTDSLICPDVGIPVYYIKVGTKVKLETDLKHSITEGFKDLVKTIKPPLLMLITNPLTRERGYVGEGIPVVSFDLIHDADYIEVTCAPRGFGCGLWATLQIFNYPPLEVIEKFILESVLRAGSKPCPPVMVGIGIGGTFDNATRLAKVAMLRRVGEKNKNADIARWEEGLLRAVNETGIGPMGLGGKTTALALNVEVSSGHGFTPVAVCFSCWPNRRMRAKIYGDGSVDYYE